MIAFSLIIQIRHNRARTEAIAVVCLFSQFSSLEQSDVASYKKQFSSCIKLPMHSKTAGTKIPGDSNNSLQIFCYSRYKSLKYFFCQMEFSDRFVWSLNSQILNKTICYGHANQGMGKKNIGLSIISQTSLANRKKLCWQIDIVFQIKNTKTIESFSPPTPSMENSSSHSLSIIMQFLHMYHILYLSVFAQQYVSKLNNILNGEKNRA